MGFWSLNFIFKSESLWKVFFGMRYFLLVFSNHNVYFRTIHVSELKFLNQNWSKTFRYTKIGISPWVFGVWSSYLNLKRLGRFSLECAIFYWSKTDSRERKPGPCQLVIYWWATGATSWTGWSSAKKMWNWENLNTCRSGSSCPWTVLKVWRRISTARRG